MNVVVDQIENPQYRAVAKQIVKKSGAGLYGKAGSGLTGRGLSGRGLSGAGLSGSGFGKREQLYARPAVMPPNFIEESGRMHTLPHKPSLPRPTRKPRFKKGSQEAKDYMASIRNNKEGSGFSKMLENLLRKQEKSEKPLFLENELVMKQILYCLLLELLLVELLVLSQGVLLVAL